MPITLTTGVNFLDMKNFIIILLLVCSVQAQAVDLYGVQLREASRDQLLNALKNSGIRLISEAGKDDFYDVYDSSQVLPNSTRFYLGFVKKDGKFAFAEYEFNGLQQRQMLQRLIAKYGKARKINGQYLTDASWTWQIDSITISLKADWGAYKTRLTYQNPAALKQLKQERRVFLAGAEKQQDLLSQQTY